MNKIEKPAPDLYSQRLARIEDAVELKKPDRVPVILEFGYLTARYYGITYQDLIYDPLKCVKAHEKIVTEMEPDAFHCIPFDSGPAMELIGTKAVKWPGHELKPNVGHQYLEAEYMAADEYDSFLEDPTGFMQKVYLPRVCATLDPFSDGPDFFDFLGFSRGIIHPLFAKPEFLASCRAIFQASQETQKWFNAWRCFTRDIENRGYPAITLVGLGQAPFDFFSDHFRGMRGIMLDMNRQPEKLLAAMESILPFLLRKIDAMTKTSGNSLVFMGPHRGAGGFMSLDQFEKFYWPGLKASILAIIEKGFTPYIFWEGDYTSRLKYLRELPSGKIIHRLDRTSAYKAREILGPDHCIAGGMTPSLLTTGSVQQVRDECRRLIESVGRDGSYIMCHSTPLDDAKIDNVMAMIETTREYGVYI